MGLSELDAAVQANYPVVCMPHEGSLADADKNGIRYVLAGDGLYRELTTDWMVRTKRIVSCQTPFGVTGETLTWRIPMPPPEVWRQFGDMARQAMPNECAALMAWHTAEHTWRFVPRVATMASAARVDYIEPELHESEVVVIDIHSHGLYPAGFSGRDDNDDRGGIKIAAVIGGFGGFQKPRMALRLVAIDEFVPLCRAHDGNFEIVEITNETLLTP